ncbi:unnamed protein product [Auanema sp. JU1783]|nr:unnamed protein product [Auanema sp. JU1783]
MGDELRVINRISKDVSSKICTAQVVSSASGAIRQLIDNAIDAEAKVIDIKVTDNGFTSLEVADDGTGIDPSNFDTICQPHATSKLSDFSDFQELTTLGFRGEALNALCALGQLTISTRHRESLVGTKLQFDHKGQQTNKTNMAKPVGTTIIVEKLFETLPVRRKEFEKTQKKEMGRIISTVQCFCLSRPDIRFILSNTVAGKRQQILCTPGKSGLSEVVRNLFGGRTDKNKMLEIEKSHPDDEICNLYGLTSFNENDFNAITLSGHISSCEHGFGRPSADRQFIYVNKRPVDFPKICRAINDVYQQYNKSQYPTVVLFIDVPPDTIDVNVTPDKRTVFYDKERVLLAIVRASVIISLKQVLGSYTVVEEPRKNINNSMLNSSTSSDLNCSSSSIVEGVPSVFDLLKAANVASKRVSNQGNPSAKRSRANISESTIRTLESFSFAPSQKSQDTNKSNTSSIFPSPLITRLGSRRLENIPSEESALTDTTIPVVIENHIPAEASASLLLDDDTHSTVLTSNSPDSQMVSAVLTSNSPDGQMVSTMLVSTPERDEVHSTVITSSIVEKISPIAAIRELSTSPIMEGLAAENERDDILKGRLSLSSLSRGFNNDLDKDDDSVFKNLENRMNSDENSKDDRSENDAIVCLTPKVEIFSQKQSNGVSSQVADGTFYRQQQTVAFDLNKFEERLEQLSCRAFTKQEVLSQTNDALFEVGLEPEEQNKAEQEFTRILSKNDFNEMHIIGQFNKGFIIARLKQNLFIIDQHASDEKFNYERFQKKACIENQKLLQPSPLNFGALQESALQDNLSIFRSNGFDFEFRSQDDGSSLAYLTSVPVLNSWQFDKGDIEEILAFVQEFPGEMYRPSKLRKIFASRACRKSVMIGTSLNKKQMQTIVRNLSKLDQPWNCPHGRPTLRHLGDISDIGIFPDV